MKLKSNKFSLDYKIGDFIALSYISKFRYSIKDYLLLLNKFVMEAEDYYLIFKKVGGKK